MNDTYGRIVSPYHRPISIKYPLEVKIKRIIKTNRFLQEKKIFQNTYITPETL